jgi:hypothetical protein
MPGSTWTMLSISSPATVPALQPGRLVSRHHCLQEVSSRDKPALYSS